VFALEGTTGAVGVMLRIPHELHGSQKRCVRARPLIWPIAQNRCDLKMLSLIGAVFGFEHITKIRYVFFIADVNGFGTDP